MTKQKQEWPAGRIVHLAGGCRAINNPGPVVNLVPNSLKGTVAQFQLHGYGAIYSSLESLGLSIVGVDFYSHVLEVEGTVPPNWRPFHRTKSSVWPVEEISQKWRNIGHAAFQRKNGKLFDLGSRIGHQLRVCSWRLREISEVYHNQLSAKVRRKDFKVDQRFEDGFTWLTYLSLQSFLVDACILRDYLSEFAAEFIYRQLIDLGKEKIATMGGLKKKVLNKISGSDALTETLKRETSTNGWITVLGSYRDLVVHSAPLAYAEKKLFSICDELRIDKRGSLPAIRCPIPENPAEIMSSRSKVDHFVDFDGEFRAFVKAAAGDITDTDGMHYAHIALGNLARLADRFAEKSPLEPEMMVFDSSNIIGEVKIEDV